MRRAAVSGFAFSRPLQSFLLRFSPGFPLPQLHGMRHHVEQLVFRRPLVASEQRLHVLPPTGDHQRLGRYVAALGRLARNRARREPDFPRRSAGGAERAAAALLLTTLMLAPVAFVLMTSCAASLTGRTRAGRQRDCVETSVDP